VEGLEEYLRDRTTQTLQRRILEKAAAVELAFFEGSRGLGAERRVVPGARR